MNEHMNEQWKTYILCLENKENFAGFAKRLGVTITKARSIGRKIVSQSREVMKDFKFCKELGVPQFWNGQLKLLPNEPRLTEDNLLAIASGVFTLEEFYGIADIAEETPQYICDRMGVARGHFPVEREEATITAG